MKESLIQKKKRISNVLKQLRRAYPNIKCALYFKNPWQLVVATILSAQCTDKRVNEVTPALFSKYKTVKDFSAADPRKFSEAIRSTGFYKNKTKSILGAAQAILKHHKGKVPAKLEDLINLPGVGRKTANVVLGNAFGIPGIPVDTHMIRLNRLLGFTCYLNPVKIEFDLMELVPQEDWTVYSSLIIRHGRIRCIARRPDCKHCEILKYCPHGRAHRKV